MFDSQVVEGGVVVVYGVVRVPEDVSEDVAKLPVPPKSQSYVPFAQKDVYKELKLRGYQYRYVLRGSVSWGTENF